MGFLKRPKAPEPTAQELAVVERQSRRLDEEIEESEKRLKAIARGRLGAASLLAPGIQTSTGSARATRSTRSGGSRGSRGSMLGRSGGGNYGSSNMAASQLSKK